MRRKFFRRGQNLVDLALIIGIVGLVLISMEVYIKRSLQGKVKDLTNYIVSNKQSGEAPDTSDVSGKTTLTLGSTIESREVAGGGRSLTGSEYSASDYSTSSTPDTSINKP